MARAVWTGSIAFGLVSIPVRVYSAVHEHRVRFHLRHRPDGGSVGYQKVCKLEGEPVPDGEIVKVYEHEDGEYVELTEEDFAAVRAEGTRTIDLEDFVPYDEIDPSFFARSYLVGPQEGAERPYTLLVRAMEDAGVAAIGKFVLRSRQYLGCLRVRTGVLTLEQLYFADEIDPPAEALPGELPEVSKRELELARSLIDGGSGAWEPDRYKDTYHEALCAVIRRKLGGEEVHAAAPEPQPEETPDLLAALRASVERARGGRRNGGGTGRGDRAELERLTKAELQRLARERELEGRSSMSKDELVDALA